MEQFPGFPQGPEENFWRYPKALNGWWHILTPTEQKVLDYILRHTWGYNKTCDAISLNQFRNGIKNKKTGEYIDRGTGIKHKKTLIKALQGLEEKGFIEPIKTRGKITKYRLKIAQKSQELVQKVNQGGSKSEPVGGSQNEPVNKFTIYDITINDKTINNKNNNFTIVKLSSDQSDDISNSSSNFSKTIKEIRKYFERHFTEEFNRKPIWEFGKEEKLVKRFLKLYTVEEAFDLIDAFFASDKLNDYPSLAAVFSTHTINLWASGNLIADYWKYKQFKQKRSQKEVKDQ